MSYVPDMPERQVPEHVFQDLISGFVAEAARDLHRHVRNRERPYSAGDPVHPGDSFGRLIGWLWKTAPAEAIFELASYVHQVRRLEAEAGTSGVQLDDILWGLSFARPPDLPKEELEALQERARRELPSTYDAH